VGQVAALGESSGGAKQQGKRGNGEVTQDRMLNPKHASTHTFPDKLTSCARTQRAGLMPLKWVPMRRRGHRIPMPFIRICPANSQLYRFRVSRRATERAGASGLRAMQDFMQDLADGRDG